MDRTEKLLQTPYWIIDILPARVPKERAGQYFPVEKFFLTQQLSVIRQKHINMILKLNCYMDIELDGEMNPPPDRIAAVMNERIVYLMTGESMLLSEPDDTHMTLFNPDGKLLELIKTLALSEGLYVWSGVDG